MANRIQWLIVAFAGAITGSPASADSLSPPRSFKEDVPGEEYVFVMIAPGVGEEDVSLWREDIAASIREIRRLYTKSGLYRNDGSSEPLWTVAWYASRVTVSG